MKSMSSLVGLVGLLASVSAHAQPAAAVPPCSEGAIVAVTPHAAACPGEPGNPTVTASEPTAHQPAICGSLPSADKIPPECSACPLVATCYPA